MAALVLSPVWRRLRRNWLSVGALALIVLMALKRFPKGAPGRAARQALLEGLRRGGRAAWLPGQDWEALLARPLEEVRRQHIRRVLEACEGNRVRAAQMLGIGRTSLYRFLKRAEKKPVNSAALQ